VTGLALIGLGAYVQIQAKEYLDFLGNQYVNTPIIFIILGVVIFIVAFLGCCGACTKNKCMMYTYASLLLLILIVEIGAGIAAYILQGQLEEVVQTNMMEGMMNYDQPKHDGVTQSWNSMQRNLQCCGVTNMDDWKNSTLTPFGKIPHSCCKVDEEGAVKEDCAENPANVFTKGCYPTMKEQFTSNIDKIGGAALGIAALQFIGVIFACCVSKRIYDSGERGWH
jgi:CD63 antigen